MVNCLKIFASSLIALVFLASCAKDVYVHDKPSLSSLHGEWVIVDVHESLERQSEGRLSQVRSATRMVIKPDGFAFLTSFPCFGGVRQDEFYLINGVGKWQLTAGQQIGVGGRLLWKILILPVGGKDAIVLFLKLKGGEVICDYMADYEEPTGIQLSRMSK